MSSNEMQAIEEGTLEARVARAELKANHALGISQATRTRLAGDYINAARYRQDREVFHSLYEEAVRGARRSLLFVALVTAIALGSFLGVAIFERNSSAILNRELNLVEDQLRTNCDNAQAVNSATQEALRVRIAASAGEERQLLAQQLELFPEPYDCSQIGRRD